METTRITPKPNGPLVVEGPVKIVTPDGRELAVPPRKDGRPAEVGVLCRCGGAATKPVFGGSQKRDGFSNPPPPAPPPPILATGVIFASSPGGGGRGGRPRPQPPPPAPPPAP